MHRLLTKLLRQIDALLGRLITLCVPEVPHVEEIPPTLLSIAVIKLWALGEAVLTLPALQALQKKYPHASVTIITTTYVAPVYRQQSSVNVVQGNFIALAWHIARHRRHYDIAVDFEPYLYISALLTRWLAVYSIGFATRHRAGHYTKAVPYNDQQHAAQAYLDLVSTTVPSVKISSLLPLHYEVADATIVDEYLRQQAVAGALVAIAPSVGHSAKNRQWPAQRFAQVADELATQHGASIILIGSPSDQKLVNSIALAMHKPSLAITHFSIPQVAVLLSRCRLLIANDSGVMHVGAAMGTPTLGLFGPNLPRRFRPLQAQSRHIWHPCDTAPHINVHLGEISDKPCTCMQRISATEVLQEATAILHAV